MNNHGNNVSVVVGRHIFKLENWHSHNIRSYYQGTCSVLIGGGGGGGGLQLGVNNENSAYVQSMALVWPQWTVIGLGTIQTSFLEI